MLGSAARAEPLISESLPLTCEVTWNPWWPGRQHCGVSYIWEQEQFSGFLRSEDFSRRYEGPRMIPGWDQIHDKNLGKLHGGPEGTKLWAWGRVLPVGYKWEWAGAVQHYTLCFLKGPWIQAFQPGFSFWGAEEKKKKGLHKAGLGVEGREDHVVTLGLPPIS